MKHQVRQTTQIGTGFSNHAKHSGSTSLPSEKEHGSQKLMSISSASEKISNQEKENQDGK